MTVQYWLWRIPLYCMNAYLLKMDTIIKYSGRGEKDESGNLFNTDETTLKVLNFGGGGKVSWTINTTFVQYRCMVCVC